MTCNISRVPQRMPSTTNNDTHFVDYDSVDHGHNNYNANQAYIDKQNALTPDRGLTVATRDASWPVNQRFVPRGRFPPTVTPPLTSTGFPNHSAHGPTEQQLLLLPQGPDVPGVPGELGNGAFSMPYMQLSFPFQGRYVSEVPGYPENGAFNMPSSSAGQFQGHLYNTAPNYGPPPSPPLPPADVYAAHNVGNGAYQQPPWFPLKAASPESGIFSVASWVPSAAIWASSPASTQAISSPENGNSSPYRCLDCPNTPGFTSLRDLERHRTTARAHWNDETKFYWCRCRVKLARKEHHLRHVHVCHSQSPNPYVCACSRLCVDKAEHVVHVDDCGRLRARRQPVAS